MSHTTNSRHSPARARYSSSRLARRVVLAARSRTRESGRERARELSRARSSSIVDHAGARRLPCRALASASFVFPRGCPRERRRHRGYVLRSRHVVTRRDAGDVVLASRRGFGRPRRNRRFRVRVRVLGQLVRSALGRRALSSTTRTRFVPHEGRAIAQLARVC